MLYSNFGYNELEMPQLKNIAQHFRGKVWISNLAYIPNTKKLLGDMVSLHYENLTKAEFRKFTRMLDNFRF